MFGRFPTLQRRPRKGLKAQLLRLCNCIAYGFMREFDRNLGRFSQTELGPLARLPEQALRALRAAMKESAHKHG